MTTQPLFDSEPTQCPTCNNRSIVPIVYGTPSKEMQLAEKLGQIVVRASSNQPIPPQWACTKPDCNYEFS
jgi:hypothetical protein